VGVGVGIVEGVRVGVFVRVGVGVQLVVGGLVKVGVDVSVAVGVLVAVGLEVAVDRGAVVAVWPFASRRVVGEGLMCTRVVGVGSAVELVQPEARTSIRRAVTANARMA
jgi:hypothetical protein